MISATQPFEPLAITGMDIVWDGHEGLDAFERLIYSGGQQIASTSIAIPDLLARTALRALRDASLADSGRTARIVALLAGPAPVLTHLAWAQQVIDLSSQPNPLVSAVAQAQRLLTGGEVDAVIFAAQSGLPGQPSGEIFASPASTAMGFDRDIHGWRVGGHSAAAAVVFTRFYANVSSGQPVYAVIRSLSASNGRPSENGHAPVLPVAPVLDDVRGCCKAALALAGITSEQVGYVETFASGNDTLDGIEITGLVYAYRQSEPDLTTAFGSVQSNLGYLGAAAGLAGLVRAALCLYQRMIPAVPGWSAPKLPLLWRSSSFYAPVESRPWFAHPPGLSDDGGASRVAGLNVIGLNGTFAHLLLVEPSADEFHPNRALEQGEFYLFPLPTADLTELLGQLGSLRQSLMSSANLPALAAQWNEKNTARSDAPYAAAIVGHTLEELLREIDLAIKAVAGAFEKRVEWQTPLGSYFTAEPVGRTGEVALVYPGAFNSYLGMARDLFRLFPWLHQKSVGSTVDLGRVLQERLLYPRSLVAPSKDEQAAQEARLLKDAVAMLTSGTAVSILFTSLLEDAFKIKPAAAFGYSLGENSMMFATGIWQEGDAATERVEQSDAFHNRLAGPQNAVREYWGLPTQAAADPNQTLWGNYLVMASYESVAQAIVAEAAARVYITHINAPRQVVIGGDPGECQRVIKALRGSSLQAPFDYALHCAPIASELDELAGLHDCPIDRMPHVRLYTAANYEPLPLVRETISRKLGQMLCDPLDFPRLVRRVYADGARVFIEAGAGSNCARWVAESLKGSPHLALSLNRRGTDDYSNLVRTMARLYSHRVPMNLSILYQPVSRRMENAYD